MRAALSSHLERLQEHFDNGDGASAEMRFLTSGFQQLLFVLLDEGGVEFTVNEIVDRQNTAQEFDVRGKADHMVVLKSHVKLFDGFLSSGSVDDKF